MSPADASVPIPTWLSHLPVVGGMAVPWVTPPLPDGRHPFGVIDHDRQATCLREFLCQVCARQLERPIVILCRDSDLGRRMTAEPGLHPSCAWYASRACPMVAGRMKHHRRSLPNIPGAPVGSPNPDDDDPLTSMLTAIDAAQQAVARLGRPAERWSAVWVSGYSVVWDDATRSLSASWTEAQVLKVRPITDAKEA
jgi:hypothetical protein